MAAQELDYISIKGFKSIASIEKLALRPVNVLIGANGSGKSNFIGAFSFLHAVREGRLRNYVREAGGADQVLHYGSKNTQQIELEISFKEGVNGYRLNLRPTNDDGLYPANEQVWFWSKPHPRPFTESLFANEDSGEAGISNSRARQTASWVRHRLGLWRVYHVHDTSNSSPMRKTAKLHDNEFLRADGSNLPAFLYLLRHRHEESYQLIRRSIQRVAPFFDDFRLQPDRLNRDTIRLAWKHKNSDQYFGSASLSDGTLRFIVLATLFLQPKEFRPSVILVDEPELGLHPYAISLLAALVKQASANSQVILSTQSPVLLDHFTPEDALVAERQEGSTALRRLNTDALEEWLDDYSLGQLWEKNELGGRPGSQNR